MAWEAGLGGVCLATALGSRHAGLPCGRRIRSGSCWKLFLLPSRSTDFFFFLESATPFPMAFSVTASQEGPSLPDWQPQDLGVLFTGHGGTSTCLSPEKMSPNVTCTSAFTRRTSKHFRTCCKLSDGSPRSGVGLPSQGASLLSLAACPRCGVCSGQPQQGPVAQGAQCRGPGREPPPVTSTRMGVLPRRPPAIHPRLWPTARAPWKTEGVEPVLTLAR